MEGEIDGLEEDVQKVLRKLAVANWYGPGQAPSPVVHLDSELQKNVHESGA